MLLQTISVTNNMRKLVVMVL